jgi:pyruvate/2-oxoglutarate dehydrogenase complex dihydrolipoamide dehydrogenase (E3) component
MIKTTHDIIVIGGGAAGLTAASGCAQLGMKTLLIEKSLMGGDCLHYGCVPSKSLLKSAKLYHQMGKQERYGLPSVTPPPVDIKKVMTRVQSVVDTIAYHDSAERFEKLGVQVIQDIPRFLSPYEISVGGKTYSSSKIVLATGSSPSIPPIPGIDSVDYLTNKTLFSLEELPSELITIGGGPIGAELSQAMLRLGSKVTLLNRGNHILDKEDGDMAAVIENRFNREGMKVVNKCSLTGVSQIGEKIRVNYEYQGTEFSLTGDRLLLSAGRKGNTEDLDLDKAGITPENSYIPVNNRLQTEQKHIYAIGDVNGKYLFTHVAGAEGSFVVRHAALKLPGHFSYDRVPWCTYTDPELSSVGYNEKRAQKAGIKHEVIISSYDEVDRAQAEGYTEGMIKTLIDKKERIIGTQIAGVDGGNLILPSIYGMSSKYKLMDILTPMVPYPTLGEIQKKSAGSYYGPKLFNNRIKRTLKFIYRYKG